MKKEPFQQIEPSVLQHPDGCELMAGVEKDKKIAEGGFGDIFSVHANIGGRNIPFVLKEYRSNLAQERAENAFENYRQAKKAGLKVFKTFRLVKDRASILMTNGSIGEAAVCVSRNEDDSSTVETFGKKRLKTISDFGRLLDGVLGQAIIANDSGMSLSEDCFMFLIDSEGGHIDFVIGDMDFVRAVKEQTRIGKAENMYAAYNALRSVIMHNVENHSELIMKLTDRFKAMMNECELPFIYEDPC